MLDPTRRFSSRAENYLRHRPSYPRELLPWVAATCGLEPGAEIADVGSGTGFLAEVFLEAGYRVHGIEPNREMREAGEGHLSRFPRFLSLDGTAEATGLSEASVDLVAAGTAFHWFDPKAARAEFARILRPGGWVVLAWNVRRTRHSPLLEEYEALLQRYAPAYAAGPRREMAPEELAAFFLPGSIARNSFPNLQHFDLDGLTGRLLSSSYAPEAGQPGHEPMLQELREIFDAHQADGRVTFAYDTQLIAGRPRPGGA
jgi:SAM-dependent methyltransferase